MQAKETKRATPKSPIAKIASVRDIETTKAAIAKKYGFVVTDKYAADLVDFVNELTEA